MSLGNIMKGPTEKASKSKVLATVLKNKEKLMNMTMKQPDAIEQTTQNEKLVQVDATKGNVKQMKVGDTSTQQKLLDFQIALNMRAT